MGTVVLHAGMGKAGSSSVQTWLARNLARLEASDVRVLTTRSGPADGRDSGVHLEEYRSGRIVSNDIVATYQAGDSEAVAASLVEQLDEWASRHRVVVVSAEAFERFFWRGDSHALAALEQLARGHEVRVAYYVRPQHTALEAHWRQWGFRSGARPSDSLRNRGAALHYFDTYQFTRRSAPSVSFEPRPFRRDLLEHGDPRQDFARTFLDVSDSSPSAAPPWSNRGLPLEVVNALRYAPPGAFWSSVTDNKGLTAVKNVLGDVTAGETEKTARSRVVLQAYCYETFEPGNRDLIEATGWSTDAFVEPPDDAPDGPPEALLRELDELWEPDASEAELQSLYAALAKAIAASFDASAASRRNSRRRVGARAAWSWLSPLRARGRR